MNLGFLSLQIGILKQIDVNMYVCMYSVYINCYRTRPDHCQFHTLAFLIYRTFIHTYIYIQADSLSKEFHKSLVVNMSLKEELLKLRRRHEEVISILQ